MTWVEFFKWLIETYPVGCFLVSLAFAFSIGGGFRVVRND